MSRIRIFAIALLLSSLAVSSALAETRGVAIILKRDKEGTVVTIHSDVKEEKKTDIPFDDALKIVAKMQGWGSSVLVCIVADQAPKSGLSDGVPPPAEVRKLLKAVEDNVWLDLVYLRIGDAKGGDDLVRHFIQATSGK